MNLLSAIPQELLRRVVSGLDKNSMAVLIVASKIPNIRKIIEDELESRQCAICYSGIVDGVDSVIAKCCDNQFHTYCLARWNNTTLNDKTTCTCPLCRRPIRGPFDINGCPIGFPTRETHNAWRKWSMDRRRREAWTPVAAAKSEHQKSVMVACDGFMIFDEITMTAEPSAALSTAIQRISKISIRNIEVGYQFCVAVSHEGEVYGWGDNQYGQLGSDNSGHEEKPVRLRLDGLDNISAVSAGHTHSVAVTHRGEALTWGTITGTGTDKTYTIKCTPKTLEPVAGIRVRSASAGGNHAIILTEEGAVYTFGCNEAGQLGHDRDTRSRNKATLVSALQHLRIASTAAGFDHSLALTEGGLVLTWGGRERQPHESNKPTVVNGKLKDIRVRYISAGHKTSCAVSVQGKLFTWRTTESRDRAHHETTNDETQPTLMEGLQFAEKVSIGIRETFAVTRDGDVFFWKNDTSHIQPTTVHNNGQIYHRNTNTTKNIAKLLNVRCSTEPCLAWNNVDENNDTRDWERAALLAFISPQTAIRDIVKLLERGNDIADTIKKGAARTLRILTAGGNTENQQAVEQSQGIRPLVNLLTHNDDATRAEAAYALTNLSDDYEEQIAEAGAIPHVVNMLRDASVSVHGAAAALLRELAASNNNHTDIVVTCGAVAPLVELLSKDRGDKVNILAAKVLRNLSAGYDNHTNVKKIAAEEGAIKHLVDMLRREDHRTNEMAASVLELIASQNETHQKISEADDAVGALAALLGSEHNIVVYHTLGVLTYLTDTEYNIEAIADKAIERLAQISRGYGDTPNIAVNILSSLWVYPEYRTRISVAIGITQEDLNRIFTPPIDHLALQLREMALRPTTNIPLAEQQRRRAAAEAATATAAEAAGFRPTGEQ